MFSPYFKSFESSDYGNKSIDLPFQSWNIIEFSSPLLLSPLALRNLLYKYILLVKSVFSYNFFLINFAKAFLFSLGNSKSCLMIR